MNVAIDLASGFVECLLLVLALAAVQAGRRLYWVAVAALVVLLYARVADGFIPDGARLALTVVGLLVAAATVVGDLLFEVVPDGGSGARPPV
ncbi:MAG: hypothetical protein NVSMB17_19380 [Candidatus Dormibacteria bacterium]